MKHDFFNYIGMRIFDNHREFFNIYELSEFNCKATNKFSPTFS